MTDVTVFRPQLGALARFDDVRARWLVFLIIEIGRARKLFYARLAYQSAAIRARRKKSAGD